MTELFGAASPEAGSAPAIGAARTSRADKKFRWPDMLARISVKLVGTNPFSSARFAQYSRRMVQSELLLQNVKVVRNDLHDADLEIRPLPSLSSSPRGEAGGVGGSGVSVWQKLTRRAGALVRSLVLLH